MEGFPNAAKSFAHGTVPGPEAFTSGLVLSRKSRSRPMSQLSAPRLTVTSGSTVWNGLVGMPCSCESDPPRNPAIAPRPVAVDNAPRMVPVFSTKSWAYP